MLFVTNYNCFSQMLEKDTIDFILMHFTKSEVIKVNKKKKIPSCIFNEINKRSGFIVDIADFRGKYNRTDLKNRKLPDRRLVFAFNVENYWLIKYFIGGRAIKKRTILVELKNDEVLHLYFVQVGNIKTKQKLKESIVEKKYTIGCSSVLECLF